MNKDRKEREQRESKMNEERKEKEQRGGKIPKGEWRKNREREEGKEQR
jgi:hypothetical protein